MKSSIVDVTTNTTLFDMDGDTIMANAGDLIVTPAGKIFKVMQRAIIIERVASQIVATNAPVPDKYTVTAQIAVTPVQIEEHHEMEDVENAAKSRIITTNPDGAPRHK